MKSLAQFAAITLLPLALLGMRCDRPPVNPTPVPAAGGSVSTGGNPAVAGETSLAGQAGAAGSATATKCQLACANLARLGCPEDQRTCDGQCEILTHDSRFTFSADCRINATTKAQAQACGIASCK
jgi:hypothetical protein